MSDINWSEIITEHLDALFNQSPEILCRETHDAARLLSIDEYEACSEEVCDIYVACDPLLLRAWARGLFGEAPDRPKIFAADSIPEPYRSALLRYSHRKLALAYADGQAAADAFRRFGA